MDTPQTIGAILIGIIMLVAGAVTGKKMYSNKIHIYYENDQKLTIYQPNIETCYRYEDSFKIIECP